MEETNVQPPATTPAAAEPTTGVPAAKTEQTPAAAPAQATEAATPDWTRALDSVDSKELRRHPKIAGLVGSEIQRAIAAEKARIQADEGTKAARQAEERLRTLANSDPVAFAEEWLSDDQKKRLQADLNEVRSKTRAEFASLIGGAFKTLPDWAELEDADHEKLVQAVQGKPDDEVIAVYNRTAVEILAERRARKQLDAWKQKELAAEREAIRKEEAAKLLSNGKAPDLRRAGAAPNLDIGKMSDEEFDKFYNKRFNR